MKNFRYVLVLAFGLIFLASCEDLPVPHGEDDDEPIVIGGGGNGPGVVESQH